MSSTSLLQSMTKEDILVQVYRKRIENQKLYRQQINQSKEQQDAVNWKIAGSELREKEEEISLIHLLLRGKPEPEVIVEAEPQPEPEYTRNWLAQVTEKLKSQRYAIQTNDGKYVSSDGNTVKANHPKIDQTSTFELIPLFTFLAEHNGLFWCCQHSARTSIRAIRKQIYYLWETFELHPLWPEEPDKLALLAMVTKKYVANDSNNKMWPSVSKDMAKKYQFLLQNK